MTSVSPIQLKALIVLVAMGAFFVRLSELDLRPMHGDEANQAHKTGILIEEGTYTYDPHDHHGPTLYYFGRLAALVAGQNSYGQTTEKTYRIVPVLFGAGLVVALLLLAPGLSPGAILITSLFLCLSPAFIFYSRYYIQESLLVFFSLTAIGFGYRYLRKPGAGLALGLGASLSLMHATKETAIIAIFSMVVALSLVLYIHRRDIADSSLRQSIKKIHVIAAIAMALLLNILLFTGFFTNWRGPLDSILTYGNYLKRADGAGLHDKPWHYYLHLLLYTKKGPQYWFSEGFATSLGFLGSVALVWLGARKRVSPLHLFLGAYTLVMIMVYALIPYKTPWSMLSFFFALTLVAGIVCDYALRSIPQKSLRIVTGALVVASLVHIGYQGHIINRVIPADPRNPYVYAHTSTAFLKRPQRADDILAVHPNPDEMRIYVIQPDGDYWPLPFYLRNHPKVGFFHAVPEAPDADMIIAAPSTRQALAEGLQGDYFTETGGLRPSVLRHVYIRRDLWDAYMADRQ